jgi:fatty acid desaturase
LPWHFNSIASAPSSSPDLDEAPQGTIDVETTFLERYLLAPFGFSDHQAHHAQLTVPFYNLPELRRLLETHQPGYVRRIKASYLVILARMIRAPLAPEMEERARAREEQGASVALAE